MRGVLIHLELKDDVTRANTVRCMWMLTWVAGAFALIVALVMVGSVAAEYRGQMITGAEFERLQAELAKDRGKPEVADREEKQREVLRQFDQELRANYWRRRAFLIHGAWLLAGGLAVMALCTKLANDWGQMAHFPTGAAPTPVRLSRGMKVTFGAVAAGLAVTLVGLRLASGGVASFHDEMTRLLAGSPNTAARNDGRAGTLPSVAGTTKPLAHVAVTVEQMKKNWPAFRGFGSMGQAQGTYPSQWDGATGKNIKWKSPVALPGKSSAVVWEKNVFVAGGSEEKRELYCYDTETGKLNWTREVGKGDAKTKVEKDTTWSPNTPATDGQRIFVIFPTGELAAFEFDGTPAWSKKLGPIEDHYGHASSLVAMDGLLFVQMDQATEKDNKSAVYAFDSATGKEVWKKSRATPATWSSPVIVPGPKGMQLVLQGDPWTIAYEPKTGAEIWRTSGLGREVAPSPAFDNGVLYAAVEGTDFLAIKVDGTGDVSKTHMKKPEVDILPAIVSPVATNGRVVLAMDKGIVFVNGTDGKTIWETDVEESIDSSPVVVGKHIYISDKKGTTYVMDSGDKLNVVAKSSLGQEIFATPAFVEGKMFIRTNTHLWCIESKGGGQ